MPGTAFLHPCMGWSGPGARHPCGHPAFAPLPVHLCPLGGTPALAGGHGCAPKRGVWRPCRGAAGPRRGGGMACGLKTDYARLFFHLFAYFCSVNPKRGGLGNEEEKLVEVDGHSATVACVAVRAAHGDTLRAPVAGLPAAEGGCHGLGGHGDGHRRGAHRPALSARPEGERRAGGAAVRLACRLPDARHAAEARPPRCAHTGCPAAARTGGGRRRDAARRGGEQRGAD